MTTASKITLSRILLTPLFFIIFYFSFKKMIIPQTLSLITLWIIYIISEASDALDGYIARRFNQVTAVGKILDPFSDVFSRVTIFYCFTLINYLPVLLFVIILWREMTMLFIRHLIQIKNDFALAAKFPGKLKAILYFLASLMGLVILSLNHPTIFVEINPSLMFFLNTILQALYWGSAIISVVSFILYLPVLKKQ